MEGGWLCVTISADFLRRQSRTIWMNVPAPRVCNTHVTAAWPQAHPALISWHCQLEGTASLSAWRWDSRRQGSEQSLDRRHMGCTSTSAPQSPTYEPASTRQVPTSCRCLWFCAPSRASGTLCCGDAACRNSHKQKQPHEAAGAVYA